MGCNVSTPTKSKKVASERSSEKSKTSERNGNVVVPMENGNDKFDRRLPLTVRQKFNIMKSWKGIARNIEETGILMFLRYVSIYLAKVLNWYCCRVCVRML